MGSEASRPLTLGDSPSSNAQERLSILRIYRLGSRTVVLLSSPLVDVARGGGDGHLLVVRAPRGHERRYVRGGHPPPPPGGTLDALLAHMHPQRAIPGDAAAGARPPDRAAWRTPPAWRGRCQGMWPACGRPNKIHT